MKIIEYHHDFAAKVADMWNKSNENWGNEDEFKTEQDVIDSENNLGNLKTYIAIDKDQVVGYCSFSQYKYDEGASYLPLINVRPDYHGKKVGKALILKVLEDAKASKWPRFDLFTWSGNIKAMPLYKKCGFFWERRNNSVHLMNFIPYVHQTQALKPYTDLLDLYKDSVRLIDMKQDGDKEKDFEIYYYRYKNTKTFLNLGFEKTGRGLVYVENPDYTIRLELASAKHVIHKSYHAKLHIENTSNQALHIDISAKDNKNIKTNFKQSLSVTDISVISIPYTVDGFDKKQDLDKTHPCLDLDLSVNGKHMNLKCGILPKNPIEIDLMTTKWHYEKDEMHTAYLNLENNLKDKTTFRIHLPKANVQFENPITVCLDKDERKSIGVPFKLISHGFYHETARIAYQDNHFEKDVKAMFKGIKDNFVCDQDKKLMIVSGNYALVYNKDNQGIDFTNALNIEEKTGFMVPKIGLPYSLEFSRIKPRIDIVSDQDVRLTYISEDHKGMILHINMSNHYGLFNVSYALENTGEPRQVSLSIPVYKTIDHHYIPYLGKVLKTNPYDGYIGYINPEGIDSHWMYNHKDKQGFIWPENIQAKVSDWHMSFEIEHIELKSNQRYQTKDFVISYAHSTFKEFKKYISEETRKSLIGFNDLQINGGNPFIEKDVEMTYTNHRKAQIEGKIHYNGSLYDLDQSISISQGLHTFSIDLSDRQLQVKRVLFRKQGHIELTQNNNLYTVDNGLIKFSADLEFSDAVYSLIYDDIEWLDSTYPQPTERAWWGDFVGGIAQRISGIQDITAIKEKREIDFVELEDNFENHWKGLKVTTYYQGDPDLKGTVTENYTLTLPGVPLIYCFTCIVNKSGKLILNKGMHRRYTLKYDITRDHVTFKEKDTKFKVTEQSLEIDIDQFMSLESDRNHHLVFYSKNKNNFFESQKDYIMFYSGDAMIIPDQSSKLLQGDFLFFTKEHLKKEDLIMLSHIEFDLT